MVLVPKTRAPDTLAIATTAEPSFGRWIDRWLLVVAQQGDAIALDVAPTAGRAWFIVNIQPSKRHCAKSLGNFSLKGCFGGTNFWGGVASLSPG